ncbi:MAG: hypothetical protein VB122_02055 [Erysipelotrichales bacterium]|nr:hypothetical protein [Erysipelotrichales bacterium]
MERIELTREQREIMSEFYSVKPTSVIFNKTERNELWKKATARSTDLNFAMLKSRCPALEHQIRRSYESGNNIQSAVFSECVYAQTFANMMGLTKFVNCYEINGFIPASVDRLLSSYHLVPRYVYSTEDKRRMLIQAGGCDGIDSALITVIDLVIYTIEFKEPGAKTSEPDLPKYGEDGVLVVTEKWLSTNPQFRAMLEEQKGLNFFEVMGSNINNFSKESIDIAVSSNYTGKKKFADVIVTEDIKGVLVMLPTNQASMWAEIEGEIRPAGRNHYKVWTPLALKRFLLQKGAAINGNIVTIDKRNLEERRERGGNRRLSGYKVTPLYFVYVEDCTEFGSTIRFDINKMQQLNPTIAGKMFFKKLNHRDVKCFYGF